tara:strand:- start:606 stop:740 length:135 start_codon:yes stop_codon:yes gene_type:complete
MGKKAKKQKEVRGKKTRQGDGRFSKFSKNKRSKLYKKRSRGQGK